MPVTVRLTASEMEIAGIIGVKRHVMNLFAGKEDTYDCPPEEGWQRHCEGTVGESAVAKWRGVYWSGAIGNYKAADVGKLQVRTGGRSTSCMIMHNRDEDESPYILVTGWGPDLVLQGWLWGRECKRQEFWRSRGVRHPAYFVPQSALRPINPRPVAVELSAVA